MRTVISLEGTHSLTSFGNDFSNKIGTSLMGKLLINVVERGYSNGKEI